MLSERRSLAEYEMKSSFCLAGRTFDEEGAPRRSLVREPGGSRTQRTGSSDHVSLNSSSIKRIYVSYRWNARLGPQRDLIAMKRLTCIAFLSLLPTSYPPSFTHSESTLNPSNKESHLSTTGSNHKPPSNNSPHSNAPTSSQTPPPPYHSSPTQTSP